MRYGGRGRCESGAFPGNIHRVFQSEDAQPRRVTQRHVEIVIRRVRQADVNVEVSDRKSIRDIDREGRGRHVRDRLRCVDRRVTVCANTAYAERDQRGDSENEPVTSGRAHG